MMPAPGIQAWARAALPPRPTPMRVSLAFVEHRVNVYLRFGQPARKIVLDRWRRAALFAPGAVCCRIKWLGNDYGTALWQLMVLQAPMPFDDAQRVAGVAPGARILLRSAALRVEFLPDFAQAALRAHDSERWHLSDRVGTYGSVMLAEVAA